MTKHLGIYLDYNATAPLLPEVFEEMQDAMLAATNPSALHSFGQKSKRWVNYARRLIGDFVQAHPDHLIFTSGGTEANNLALLGGPWTQVFSSGISHDSVFESRKEVQEIPVDSQGILDSAYLERKLNQLGSHASNSLISIILAHNETGVIQPIEEIVSLARHYKAYVHVDAVQALGKIPFSFREMDVDMMTIASHKIGGPQGVGALIAKDTLPLKAIIKGGGQERGYRSGTENVGAIVGFGACLKQQSLNHMKTLGQYHSALENKIEDFCRSLKGDVHIYSQEQERLPNTTCVSMPHVENAIQLMRFDLRGVAVSMGSACSSGRTQVSRSLQKMGPSPSYAVGAIRVSSGWGTRPMHLDQFFNVWKEIYTSLTKEVTDDSH